MKNKQYRKTAIAVALLFISSTITFSIGSAQIKGYFAGTISNGLLSGVLLESYTGLAVALIGFLMLPLLAPYRKKLAYSYFGLRLIECLVIIASGIFMLQSLTALNNYDLMIYTFTGLGGIILAYLLYISKLVPSWISILGIVGYITLLVGIPTELLGGIDLNSNTGVLFFIPGGLFELILPIFLLVRGFNVDTQLKPADSTA